MSLVARLIPSMLSLVASLWSSASSSFVVNLLIGLSASKKLQPLKIQPYQPSMLNPGMVSAPIVLACAGHANQVVGVGGVGCVGATRR